MATQKTLIDRREFLSAASLAGLGVVAGGCVNSSHQATSRPAQRAGGGVATGGKLELLPYPQGLTPSGGSLKVRGKASFEIPHPSPTTETASASLKSFLPAGDRKIPVRLGSVEEGYDASWLSKEDNEFLTAPGSSLEASILRITRKGITVVGKGKWGMLYGLQTVNQLLVQAAREKRETIPCLTTRDWTDMKWRCLSPTLTWYSGWNRLEGYDLCNWSEGEWKWLADWSMLHKCNAWAVCMYGYWPFTLPGYENETLDVDSFFFNPKTGKKEPHRFTHRNIKQEFYPEVIRYANARGVNVHAYIGKNSFNGRAFGNNAATNAGGAAEMLPFAPGVEEYWDAFIGRILDIGFNGFVFEDPEANHVPNQNEQCYKTFWEPWAKTYGFSSVQQTDPNNPPLGVHIEYYTWLFRTFDRLIQKHAKRLGCDPEIYLISHFLLARIVNESKTVEERQKWLALVDEKQGRKVPFIINEDKETAYVEMFGGDRVASLGGRGGSCTNAMRRIASVNNNWCPAGFGGDLVHERNAQNRIVKAGGFGAMGYVFEWTNTEVFAYLAAQHLWRNAGIPGVSNTDQTGILYYAYRQYYGDEVGHLAAQAMDEGSDVNDAMVHEDIKGSQYPFTGKALHRDYQLLAVLADHAEQLARQAYQLYTGQQPKIFEPAYDPDAFSWNGYDAARDKLFKTERLRRLWLSTRRSQEMCNCALAHRLAQRLIAEKAPAADVLKQLDRAVELAKANQLISQINYDDDYDATDGLCAYLTEKLETLRAKYASNPAAAVAEAPVLFISWEKQTDILPPARAAQQPGLYLSTGIALTAEEEDYYRTAVVFSVQAQTDDGAWKTIFRRGVGRREAGWQSWDIPLDTLPQQKLLRLRFVTDSYSRAMDRTWPTWKWALWGSPQLVRLSKNGERTVVYDFAERVADAKRLVRLDKDGKERAFDNTGADSTGATFQVVTEAQTVPKSLKNAIAAFTPHKPDQFGVTVAEYEVMM